jgi:enoyl-CoA hydratase/carnithine racemase
VIKSRIVFGRFIMGNFKWNEAPLDSKWEQEECFFERKGPVARFTLNLPDKRNRYSGDMWAGMRRACDELAGDPTARVLVVTGAGEKAFCAGAGTFSKTPGQVSPDGRPLDTPWRDRTPELNAIQKRKQRLTGYLRHKPIWDLDIPVVCRMNGLAVGAGADWVMACDVIVAADHAFLGWWYTKRGLATDMGGCWYLTQVVGPYQAKEIIFTGRDVSAQELKGLGVVSRVVPYAQLDAATDELCDEIIECAPMAISADKELIDRAVNMPRWPWFEYSTHLIMACIDSDDFSTQRFSSLRGGTSEWQNR